MVLPQFDLQGGLPLAAARCASVTALLSVFGALTFRVVVAPPALEHAPAGVGADTVRRLMRISWLSLVAAVLGLAVWLLVQSATMSDAGSLSETIASLPTVLTKTSFGHVLALQFAALLVTGLALGRRDSLPRQRAAFAAATVAVCLEAGHSHAASMYQGPSVLLWCDAVHLIASGAWLGGLAPLLVVILTTPAKTAAAAARWFSPMGKACVAALAGTALVQSWVLVSSIPGLVGTAYGWMIIVKLALFAVLIGFALANRYRFAPALLGAEPAHARRVLVRSIVLQTGAALAILFAAEVLSGLPPAMHLQALWPFAKTVSFEAVREDPDFRREVIEAALALDAGLALLAAAFALRRRRLPAAAVLAVVAWFAVPQFDLLLADAYPTSFYHSPTGFSSEIIAEGGTLFAQNCVACHGAGGAGDGVLANTLPVPPADLTASHLWMHSDGELFWWLAHGIRTPEGGQAMPGFGGKLDDDQRWALIDYVRAYNAGVAFHATGAWPVPVHAPGFSARCGADTLQLADLRGRFVRLVFGTLALVPPDSGGATTVVASGTAPPGTCVVRVASVAAAYAIVAGVPAGELDGTQFIIDAGGWLRAAQSPGRGPGWDDPTSLRAEIDGLRMHPVAAGTADMDHMDMRMNMKMPM